MLFKAGATSFISLKKLSSSHIGLFPFLEAFITKHIVEQKLVVAVFMHFLEGFVPAFPWMINRL